MSRTAMPNFQVILSEEVNGEFPIRLSATVTEGNKPSVGAVVNFYGNAELLGSVSTRGDGRAIFDATLTEGTYSFDAAVVEEPTVVSHPEKRTLKRSIPKTPPVQMPADVDVAALGGNGNYLIAISVLDKDGKGCNARIYLVRKSDGAVINSSGVAVNDDKRGESFVETDTSGRATISFSFTEKEIELAVNVMGLVSPKNPIALRLLGPEPRKTRPSRLEIKPGEEPRSILEAIQLGLGLKRGEG
ncbi:MAG: hypothetical protein KGL39_16045 [Patescibacteria group bacterium]|nr:hypothetical protein [Patescibacteria group bacterium]